MTYISWLKLFRKHSEVLSLFVNILTRRIAINFWNTSLTLNYHMRHRQARNKCGLLIFLLDLSGDKQKQFQVSVSHRRTNTSKSNKNSYSFLACFEDTKILCYLTISFSFSYYFHIWENRILETYTRIPTPQTLWWIIILQNFTSSEFPCLRSAHLNC